MEPVLITRIGVVCAAGLGRERFAQALRDADSRLLVATDPALPLAGSMPLGRVHHPLPALANRSAALALVAADEALAAVPLAQRRGIGLSLGCCTGGMTESEGCYLGDARAAAPAYRRQQPHRVAQLLARHAGLRGPQAVHAVACASSGCAIAEAADWIRAGLCQRVLAVGSDALCRVTMAGFASLRVVDPVDCRPLCADRAGMNLGEGAAALLLESAPAAAAAGRVGLAELAGWGSAADAHHATAPDPAGGGLQRAIRCALAGRPASAIAYANLHGTGTRDNDAVEARVLADLGLRCPVASCKGGIGHTMGAASAIEAVACVLALEEGRAWASPGATPDRAMPGLDVVCGAARPLPEGLLLSTSLAFGGANLALLFARSPA